MSTGRIENFVGAQNFCTGSQTDYSTCIANNLRFLPFNEDTYSQAGFAGISISQATLPYIAGTSYVKAQPLAIANIVTRQLQKNSFGVVSFRCLDVFSKPRLPLPRLQDLGLPEEELLNITEIDMTVPEEDKDDALDFYGIPLVDVSTCEDDLCRLTGHFQNVINLSIGYSKAVSIVVNQGDLIAGTINNLGNYYLLPDYAIEMDTKAFEADEILERSLIELQGMLDNLTITHDYFTIMNNMIVIAEGLIDQLQLVPLETDMHVNVTWPLISTIDSSTDFTVYDFEITKAVAEYLAEYDFSYLFNISFLERELVRVFGVRPRTTYTEENYQLLLNTIGVSYATELFDKQSNMLILIQRLYNYSSVPQILDETNAILATYNILLAYESFYTTDLQGKFLSSDPDKDLAMEALIDSSSVIIGQFTVMYSGGDILQRVGNLYNPADSDAKDLIVHELDLYFSEVGDVAKILDARHRASIVEATQVASEDKLNTVDFSTDFKDSGVFHFADIAYSIGFSRITDLKQILIDDEVYNLTGIVDEDGNPVTGVSSKGCTKFTFTRHVMPTYSPVIEMYVYPGTPDQPYCPTVNKYHNYNACSYSGMFSKLLPTIDQNSGSDMGLYVFKGYEPMKGTVQELIRIGKVDINSINLNDPSLDNKSYETMIQKEVLNLTNADSIVNDTITTDDLKYYLSSKIVNESQLNNYPNMALVEFKNFPLGSSFNLPKISLLLTAEDPIVKA